MAEDNSSKNQNIIQSFKRDFELYRKESEKLPGSFSSGFQRSILFVLQWMCVFMVLTFFFLLLFIAFSGTDMALGIADKYFKVPVDQLSIEGAYAIKRLLIWMFVLIGLMFAALAFVFMRMRKLLDGGVVAIELVRKMINDGSSKVQFFE